MNFKIHLLSANYIPGTSEGTGDSKMKMYYPFLLITPWDPLPKRQGDGIELLDSTMEIYSVEPHEVSSYFFKKTAGHVMFAILPPPMKSLIQ